MQGCGKEDKNASSPLQSENHVGLVLSLTGDLNALRIILLYHFSNGVFINGGLEGGVTNLLKTLQGNNLQVMSVRNNQPSVHLCPQNQRRGTNLSAIRCLCIHDYTPQPSWPEANFQFLPTFDWKKVFWEKQEISSWRRSRWDNIQGEIVLMRAYLYCVIKFWMTTRKHISSPFLWATIVRLKPNLSSRSHSNNSIKEPVLIFYFKGGYYWRKTRTNKSWPPVISINTHSLHSPTAPHLPFKCPPPAFCLCLPCSCSSVTVSALSFHPLPQFCPPSPSYRAIRLSAKVSYQACRTSLMDTGRFVWHNSPTEGTVIHGNLWLGF